MTNGKSGRLDTIRMIISSREVGSQQELLDLIKEDGYTITQATLSRDLKQLKVAKATSSRGRNVYVLPSETMYKRVQKPLPASEMLKVSGFLSIKFSGNMGVIRTLPGYASSIAYNIDNSHLPEILGTIAGDDTIFVVIKEGTDHNAVVEELNSIVVI